MDQGWGHPDRIRWTAEDLAETIGVAASTVQRWQTGETCPQLKGLRAALVSWKLTETQRHALLAARQASYDEKKTVTFSSLSRTQLGEPSSITQKLCNDDTPSMIDSRMVSHEDGGDVDRRDLLMAGAKVAAGASVAHISSLNTVLDLSDIGERYRVLRALAESVIVKKYEWRLEEARRIDTVCKDAALQDPNRDNHNLAAMAATMHSILLRHTCPREALQVAARAQLNACYGGRNLVRIWAATAYALNAKSLGKYNEAISTLEPVMTLVPERGTRLIFAASTLAEAYGARGEAEKANGALILADRARQSTSQDDEFKGTMNFLPQHHRVHAGQALLSTCQYSPAISVSTDALRIYENEPDNRKSSWYMMQAELTIATASARLGEWDAVEAYTEQALRRVDARPSAHASFNLLLEELNSSDIPIAVSLREQVKGAVVASA